MEIVIGSGSYIVSNIEKGGRKGVTIRLLRDHGHEVDTNADKAIEKSIDHCTIWFANLKSARMFQDQVTIACLLMNGYEVTNNDSEPYPPYTGV